MESGLFALILFTTLSIFDVNLCEMKFFCSVVFSFPIGGLSGEVIMKRVGSLVATMFWVVLESVSISKCPVFSDWGIVAMSIFRNDRLTSNWILFCSAACFAPCWKSASGYFLGVLVPLREVSFLNQLVAFLGVDATFILSCYRFWFFMTPFLTFSGVQLVFFWMLLGYFPWPSNAWFPLNRSFYFFLVLLYIRLPFYMRPCV